MTVSFNDLVRTAQKALFILVVKTSQSVFYIAKVAVCAEIHTNKTGNVRVNVTLKRVYMSIAAVEGYKYCIFCVCVSVALVIQHATYMCHILWSYVVCLSLHFFSHYLTEGTHIRKTLLNIKYVLIFFTAFV